MRLLPEAIHGTIGYNTFPFALSEDAAMSIDHAKAGVESATESPLLQERRGDIEILTLNRSAGRNSLSMALMTAVTDALAAIGQDTKVRAVVLASTGPAFCAGHDLKEMTAHRKDEDGGLAFFTQTMQTCSTMMQAVVNLPQPVIAAVQGVATAAGCQLVASCDLAVAASNSRFATPGVDIGLFCSTPMVALSRNVSRKHAMEMLLTGEMTSAEDAVRIGLINRAVAPGTELQEALALAEKIAKKSPHAVRTGKRAFYHQSELGLAEAYAYTSEIMVKNLLAHDAQEGICAFIEKRHPNWDE
jgi:enoyl-CoA hydratase/carnithine racemase